MAVRAASHAGSWYDSSPTALSDQLDLFLDGADVAASRVRAVIAPHAGYSYSGATAAFAYKSVDTRGMCVGSTSHTIMAHSVVPDA
jgi:AmmeMemoRadiSam system protein B